jgi:hypothetical protein
MQVGIVFLFLAPYAVAVVMPSWRWLLVYAVVVGGLLTAWFAGIATAPMRTGMEGIGLLYIVPIAASTAAGTLIRTATLIMAARGRSGVVAVSALGLTIPMGILGAIIVWANWESRPPSDTCLRTTFHVELAGGHLAIPARPRTPYDSYDRARILRLSGGLGEGALRRNRPGKTFSDL